MAKNTSKPEVQAETSKPEVQVADKTPKVADASIVLVVTENPKRGASKARYELYKTCTTIHSYIKAGGRAADIPWDLKRGFIKFA